MRNLDRPITQSIQDNL